MNSSGKLDAAGGKGEEFGVLLPWERLGRSVYLPDSLSVSWEREIQLHTNSHSQTHRSTDERVRKQPVLAAVWFR